VPVASLGRSASGCAFAARLLAREACAGGAAQVVDGGGPFIRIVGRVEAVLQANQASGPKLVHQKQELAET
jgi:hypothetical protein